MGLIRTKTFIKYARINLQEAEQAFQKSEFEDCLSKLKSCTDALIKAVAAALPAVQKDFFSLSEKQFSNYLLDLCFDEEHPKEITRAIFDARSLAIEGPCNREVAEKALERAGSAFRRLHDIFGSLGKFH